MQEITTLYNESKNSIHIPSKELEDQVTPILRTIYSQIDVEPKYCSLLVLALANYDFNLEKSKDRFKKLLLLSIEKYVLNFNAQDIANTLNALARLGLEWENITTTLQSKLFITIQNNAPKLNEQEISNTINALAKMNLYWCTLESELQEILLTSIHRNVELLNEQGISNCLHGLAAMGLEFQKNDPLQSNLAKSLILKTADRIEFFNEHACALSFHSLFLLRILPKDIETNIVNMFMIRLKQILRSSKSKLKDISYLQIYTAFVHMCMGDIDRETELNKLLESKGFDLKEFENIAHRYLRKMAHVSKTQKDIFDVLRAHLSSNEPAELEYVIGCEIVDIFLSKRNLIIEVNGPQHFLPNGEANFRTLRKQRFLESLGYQVIHVNYDEWEVQLDNMDIFKGVVNTTAVYVDLLLSKTRIQDESNNKQTTLLFAYPPKNTAPIPVNDNDRTDNRKKSRFTRKLATQ